MFCSRNILNCCLTNENYVTSIKTDWSASQDPVLLPEHSEIDNTLVRGAAYGNEVGDLMGDVSCYISGYSSICQPVLRSVGRLVSRSASPKLDRYTGQSNSV